MTRLFLTSFAVVLVGLSANAQTANFTIGDVPEAPEAGGYRYLQVATSVGGLNVRLNASTQGQVLGALPDGTVLTNLGCQAGADRAWCDVQPVAGGTRGYVAAEYLRPAISLNGAPPRGPNDSAERAGLGDFDATGSIPCAQSADQPMTACEFGVARGGGGDATVSITKPDGSTRAIFFVLGTGIAADVSQADYGEFGYRREGDLSFVTVGTERYEIPDAVVVGG